MSASFWNGIIADHAASQLRATETVTPIRPCDLTRDQWTYKGWEISFDMPPIPNRNFDWTATSPDFDCDGDSEGFHICSGQQVHAATYKELLVEIECAIDEGEPA